MDEQTHAFLRLVCESGKFLLKKQPHAKIATLKDAKDYALDADTDSENILIPGIKKIFPGITVFSEEAGGEMARSGWQAIFDPLDATINYSRQDVNWSVSAGIYLDHIPYMAAVIAPKMDRLLWMNSADPKALWAPPAHAFGGGRELAVSKIGKLADAIVFTEIGKGMADESFAAFRKLYDGAFRAQTRCAATHGIASVALGNIDGYYHPCPTPFDVAGAAPIVMKAGGKVTDKFGEPWHPLSQGIVATNGLIHDEMLRTVTV